MRAYISARDFDFKLNTERENTIAGNNWLFNFRS